MISNEMIEQQLLKVPEVGYVKVEGDGYHYHLIVVSDVFLGMAKIARQKWVYAQLKEHIKSGSLHALNMETWTKQEWEDKRGQISH